MKKRLICLLTSMIITGSVFAGCSNSKSVPSEQQKGSTPKNITLKIAWWGNQTRTDRTLAVLKMYEDKNPGIKFESEYYAWADYWTKISTEVAGGNAPDIMQQDYGYLNQFNSKGLLVDLTPYTTNGELNVANIDKSALTGGMIDNKMVALSLGSNALCTAYDPELFKKAGVAEPTSKWNWDDYMNTVLTIHSKLGIFGDGVMSFGDSFNGSSNGFRDYLRQHGQKLFSSDNKKLGYTDDKYFVDFYGMEMELYKAGALPSPAQRLEVKTAEQELIVSGKAAMAETNCNAVIAMSNAAKKTLKLVSFPNDPKQTQNGQFIKPAMFFSILKDCKDKDASVKFIDFFTNDIDANKKLNAERGIPISSAVRDALKPTLDDTTKSVFDYVDSVSKVASIIDPPDPAAAQQIQDLSNNLEQQILFGKITTEDAAKSFRTQANDILSK